MKEYKVILSSRARIRQCLIEQAFKIQCMLTKTYSSSNLTNNLHIIINLILKTVIILALQQKILNQQPNPSTNPTIPSPLIPIQKTTQTTNHWPLVQLPPVHSTHKCPLAATLKTTFSSKTSNRMPALSLPPRFENPGHSKVNWSSPRGSFLKVEAS